MTRKQRRLTLIGLAGVVLAAGKAPPGSRVRMGGLVEAGSLVKGTDGSVKFVVTDGNASVPVAYTGILPDLFREGQGVVTEGSVGKDGVFAADTVLAKHDERYMPKEVVDALKAQGVWEEGQPGGKPAPSVPAAKTSESAAATAPLTN